MVSWDLVEIPDPNSGPSQWKTIRKYQNRSIMLTQESKIYDNSVAFQRPSLFLLKEQCSNNLNFELEMYQNSLGTIGICFRFISQLYFLEILF